MKGIFLSYIFEPELADLHKFFWAWSSCETWGHHRNDCVHYSLWRCDTLLSGINLLNVSEENTASIFKLEEVVVSHATWLTLQKTIFHSSIMCERRAP